MLEHYLGVDFVRRFGCVVSVFALSAIFFAFITEFYNLVNLTSDFGVANSTVVNSTSADEIASKPATTTLVGHEPFSEEIEQKRVLNMVDGNEKKAVIWMHGLGDSPSGWSHIESEFRLPKNVQVRFLFSYVVLFVLFSSRARPCAIF